jgi:hypothetical protein
VGEAFFYCKIETILKAGRENKLVYIQIVKLQMLSTEQATTNSLQEIKVCVHTVDDKGKYASHLEILYFLGEESVGFNFTTRGAKKATSFTMES